MSAIEASAQAFGLRPVWDDAEIERDEVYLWPENVEIWNLFNACGSQWMEGLNGRTGLIYTGVEVVMNMRGVKKSKRPDVFSKIQVMERAMLNAWSEKRNG